MTFHSLLGHLVCFHLLLPVVCWLGLQVVRMMQLNVFENGVNVLLYG